MYYAIYATKKTNTTTTDHKTYLTLSDFYVCNKTENNYFCKLFCCGYRLNVVKCKCQSQHQSSQRIAAVFVHVTCQGIDFVD